MFGYTCIQPGTRRCKCTIQRSVRTSCNALRKRSEENISNLISQFQPRLNLTACSALGIGQSSSAFIYAYMRERLSNTSPQASPFIWLTFWNAYKFMYLREGTYFSWRVGYKARYRAMYVMREVGVKIICTWPWNIDAGRTDGLYTCLLLISCKRARG